jgi:hypothetical protein
MGEDENMTEADDALECANEIMKSQGTGARFTNYIGEWNTLMLYLEKCVRDSKV